MRSKAGIEQMEVVKVGIKLQLEEIKGFLGLKVSRAGEHERKCVILVHFVVIIDRVFPVAAKLKH